MSLDLGLCLSALCAFDRNIMSAVELLNITARRNQPFTHNTQPGCRKQCCPAVRNSTRWGKIVCGSMAKRSAGWPKRRPGHRSQVADQPVPGNTAQQQHQQQQQQQQQQQGRGSSASFLAVTLAAGSILLQSAPAIAFTIHQEPENALSFPTWVIHISSVIEWAIAMSLVWKYAEVTGTAKCTMSLQGARVTLRNDCQLYCQTPKALCAADAYSFIFDSLLMLLYYVYSLLCLCQLDQTMLYGWFR